MTPIEILELIANDAPSFRDNLLRPARIGEFAYATNGRVCARFPAAAAPNVPERHRFPRADALSWDGMGGSFVALPEVPPIKKVRCSSCGGSGRIRECDECDGEGEVHWTSDGGYDYSAECAKCDGEGTILGLGADKCDECHGTGQVDDDDPRASLDMGGYRIGLPTARLLARIPGVRVETGKWDNDNPKPILFRVANGEGIFMPMSEPT